MPRCAQSLKIGDGYSRNALHGQYIAAGVLPVDLGNVEQLVVLEVAAQLTGIGGLPAHIQFIENDQLVVRHHLHRTQASPIGMVFCSQPRQGKKQCHVLADDRFYIRAHYLDHDPLAAVQGGAMHLGHRSRGHGRTLEAGKQLGHRFAQRLLDNGDGLLLRKRRYIVLQPGQLVRDILGQQVAPRGQHLPELYENRPQFLQRTAQAHSPRQIRRRVQAPWRKVQGEARQRAQALLVDKLIESIAADDTQDFSQTQDAGHGSAPQLLQALAQALSAGLQPVYTQSQLL